MKALKNYIEKIKPNFEEGGKYHKWLPVFETFETFLFVPEKTTPVRGSHIRDSVDIKRTMITVVIALIPVLLFGIWNVGYQNALINGEDPEFWPNVLYGLKKVLPIVIVSYVFGLATEFVFAMIKGHELEEGYLVSGMLIPLTLPPDIPLWMVALSTIFAVIIAKEVFGGTGMNILNPALTARAFLFFAYPAEMSGDIWISGKPEAVSGATPLAQASAGDVSQMPDAMDMLLGTIPGSIGETSAILILLGGIYLVATGIGSWRIMLSAIAGGLFMGAILNLTAVNPFMEIPFWQHLIMGSFAFGIVYMATDPVSAAQTPRGKYIYGFLVGLMAIIIRVLNPAYPEGVMLAILLMNVMAPLIDYYVVQGNIKRRLKRAKA